jgi:hypothetical protein
LFTFSDDEDEVPSTEQPMDLDEGDDDDDDDDNHHHRTPFGFRGFHESYSDGRTDGRRNGGTEETHSLGLAPSYLTSWVSYVKRVRAFNDEFTQALLRSTFNTFHSCAELGMLGLASIKNRRLLKRLNRQKRDRVLSRQKRLAPLLIFGTPAVVAGLIISKSRVITPIQKKY